MTRVSSRGHGNDRSQSDSVNTTKRGPGRPPVGYVALEVTSGNPLQVLVAQRMRDLGSPGQPLSMSQVVARSGKRGGKPGVSKPSVSNILAGRTVALQPQTIEGLARALDVEPRTIRLAIEQAAHIQMELPDRFTRLSPEAWHQLVEYGNFLLEREGKVR